MKLPATYEIEVVMGDQEIQVIQRFNGDQESVNLSRYQALLVAQEILRLADDDSKWGGPLLGGSAS